MSDSYLDIPFIPQQGKFDCGVACLSMVAAYWRIPITYIQIREKTYVSDKGISVQCLLNISNGIGLPSRAIRVTVPELVKLKTPAILYWKKKHYVVLKSINNGYVTIHNPSQGIKIYPLNFLNRFYLGIAIEFSY